MAKDWNKIKELTREISSLAFDLKRMTRSYVVGAVGDINVDKIALLPKVAQIYQNLQAKMDELKVEWLK